MPYLNSSLYMIRKRQIERMIKIGKVIAIGSLLWTIGVLQMKAQNEEDFSPDSPGATTGPDIMPLGKVDWETGTAHEWNKRNGGNERVWTINTSTFRMGLTQNAELRLQLDVSSTHTLTECYSGISQASFGTKIKIFEGTKALPKVAFLGTFLLPGGERSQYLPQHMGIQTHLLFENEINDFLSLGYDIGMEWSGDTDNPNLFFGACLNIMPNDRLSFFIESYNLYNSQKQDDWAKTGKSCRFDCMSEIGFAYMLSERLQVHAYTDISFNELSKYSNIGIGVSWLLN